MQAPYQQLLTTLNVFATSLHAAQPTGAPAARWGREVQALAQALVRLRSPAEAGPSTAIATVARRLTQLARSQDGLRLEASSGAPAEQLRSERQMVVLAAWQLVQALEQAGPGEAGIDRAAAPGTGQ